MSFTNIGLNTPTPGDPAVRNSWGTVLNTDYDIIDNYTAGQLSKDVSGNTDVVLTFTDGAATEAQHSHFIFTGVLTGNIKVFYPQSIQLNFSASNQTTGAFTLTLAADNGSHSPAGTTQAIANTGVIGNFRSDGTNILSRNGVLTNTGVVAGSYTNASLTVGADGRLTAASTNPKGSQIFTSSGTFTAPSTANSASVFKFTITGGGGAGGPTINYGAGGAAGTCIVILTGVVTASQSISVTVGAGGSHSTPTAGTASAVTVGANTYTANGGGAASVGGGGAGGTATGTSAINLRGGGGGQGQGSPALVGVGGASYWGGGTSGPDGSATPCYGAGSGNGIGGNGGPGIVVIEWW